MRGRKALGGGGDIESILVSWPEHYRNVVWLFICPPDCYYHYNPWWDPIIYRHLVNRNTALVPPSSRPKFTISSLLAWVYADDAEYLGWPLSEDRIITCCMQARYLDGVCIVFNMNITLITVMQNTASRISCRTCTNIQSSSLLSSLIKLFILQAALVSQ